MTPEEREALLAGYALGSLSDPDARDAERLIRTDDTAARELEAYRDLADLIALSVPMRRTDPGLRDRVIRAARRSTWRTRRDWRRYLPAASLAAALTIVTIWAISLQTTIHDLRNDQAALAAIVEADAKRLDLLGQTAANVAQAGGDLGVKLETALRDQQLILSVQADPEGRSTELRGTAAAHGAKARYIWSDANNAGVLLVAGMPPLPVGASYRVVLEDSKSNVVATTTFTADNKGDASAVLDVEGDEQPVRVYVEVLESDGSEGPAMLYSMLDRYTPSTPEPTATAQPE